jgi:hypothetical protein
MVDDQPPRPDGAATGWLQWVPYRLLAGRPAGGGFGLLAPREHLVARDTKWATKLVEGICPPVLHGPRHPPPPHRRFACRNQRSCLRAYGPWLISLCAVPHKPLQQQQPSIPSPGAGLGWHGFYEFALPSICCQPCCAPLSAPLKQLFLSSSPLPVISTCSSQLVPYGACCLPLRAWNTYSSALGRTCSSCGRGCCIGLLHPASLPWTSLK